VLVSAPVGDLEITMTQATQITNKRLRTGVILCFGQMVREVDTASDCSALAIGNSVKHSATQVNKFDKDSTPNQTLALHASAAATTTTVPVLFGWYGAL